MKRAFLLLSMIYGLMLSGQNNTTKVPEDVSIQINQLDSGTIELRYEAIFMPRTGRITWNDSVTFNKDFLKREVRSFKLPTDEMGTVTLPAYFLDDPVLTTKEIEMEEQGYNLPFYIASFPDSKGELYAYTDSVGNGTIVVIPEGEGGTYRVLGAINLYQQIHSFNEKLVIGEKLHLNRRPALAIRLEHVEDNLAVLHIGLDILKNSKDEPAISGTRFYAYTLFLDQAQPTFVGWNKNGKTTPELYDFAGQEYQYIPAFIDRAENGSLLLQKLDNGNFLLRGIYSYMNRLFEIDNELRIGEEFGVKTGIAIADIIQEH